VIVGVTARGKKRFLAIEDGVCESTQSWREVLLSLKSRGMNAPKLAIGDGAMGFWAAMDEVYAELENRIWREEASQIFAWAIEGCLEWQSKGLPRPRSITSATEQYFEDQDLFGAWLEDSCDLGDRTNGETAAQLFISWKFFCEAAGERPGSQKALGNRLRVRGLSNGAKRADGSVKKVWFGISLKGGAYQ
jgi:hypothetical protein